MKSVFAVRLIIEPIENRAVVAGIVDGLQLGSIEEPAAANAVGREKFPELGRAEAQADVTAALAEGAIGRVDVAKQAGRAEAGAGGGLHDQTCLIAELGVGVPVISML